jgi:hypothetical protein
MVNENCSVVLESNPLKKHIQKNNKPEKSWLLPRFKALYTHR